MTNKNKEEDSYLYEYFMLASTLLGILLILLSDMDFVNIPRNIIVIPLSLIYTIFIIRILLNK